MSAEAQQQARQGIVVDQPQTHAPVHDCSVHHGIAWDATLYTGLRLWRGAELWINPEINEGFGLSTTLGVAGYPSGEAYKVGSNYLYTRVPRMFIRQTIGLSGETEEVEPRINQFEGSRLSNRLVVAFGKFAVTDIFDTNRYAHNPRNDFLNWALIDTGTFDYAADA